MDSLYFFLEKNSYYVVLIITSIIWLGMFLSVRGVNKNIEKFLKK